MIAERSELTADLEAEARAEHVARAERAAKATLDELLAAATELAQVQSVIDRYEAAKKAHAITVNDLFQAQGRPDEQRSQWYTTIALQTTFKGYNPLAAMTWAKATPGLAPMLVREMVDQDALVSLIKTGVLKDVPGDVIQIEQKNVVRVQSKMIAALLEKGDSE